MNKENKDFEIIDIDLSSTYTKPDNHRGSETLDNAEVVNNSDDETPKTTKSHSKTASVLKEIGCYLLIVVLAFVFAKLTNAFLIVNARIPTGSMVPTIMQGTRIVGNRLAYINSKPERGDIVIFYYPDNEEEKYIKRVIGLPGETVEIINGEVFINGEFLDESAYLKVKPLGTFGPYEVPEDCYFMLGDNRNSSRDSRWWKNKYVSSDKIIAKALFSYYPTIGKIK